MAGDDFLERPQWVPQVSLSNHFLNKVDYLYVSTVLILNQTKMLCYQHLLGLPLECQIVSIQKATSLLMLQVQSAWQVHAWGAADSCVQQRM